MLKKIFLAVSVAGVCFSASASYSLDLGTWLSMAGEGSDKICDISNIPISDGRVTPTAREHRVQLYLRCEDKGGDEFIGSGSCCDHLTSGDSNTLGVCPDALGIGAVKSSWRYLANC